MILRPYQLDAINAVYDHFRSTEPGNEPCVVIPTGGGKTPIMAQICIDAVGWNRRVMVVAHRKELVKQTANRLEAEAKELGKKISIGIYSAGMGWRDTKNAIIVGQIQSVYSRMEEFGHRDLIMPDECHRIPPAGDGQYRKAIASARAINPKMRIAGFTATPYRLNTGPLCGPGQMLSSIVHESGIRELIDGGWLCPLVTKQGSSDTNTNEIRVSNGEFVKTEVNSMMEDKELVARAVYEMVKLAEGRHTCLVFCVSIRHAEMVLGEIKKRCPGEGCTIVTGATDSCDRDRVAKGIIAGRIRWTVNCEVYTEGFDAPNIDFVAILRPTMSAGLFYQMAGRGFRTSPEKTDCVVADFGGNVARHGRLSEIVPGDGYGITPKREGEIPQKTCPKCRRVVNLSERVCEECGNEFSAESTQRKINHSVKAAVGDIIGGTVTDEWLTVSYASYGVHRKSPKTSDSIGKPTMRVEYVCEGGRKVKEWVCFEHGGIPWTKAQNWWFKRFGEKYAPTLVQNAVDQIAINNDNGIGVPDKIRVRKTQGDQFEQVLDVRLVQAKPKDPAAPAKVAAKDWWSPAGGFLSEAPEQGTWLAEGDTYF